MKVKFIEMGKFGFLIDFGHLKAVRTGYFAHMWYALVLSTYGLCNAITGYIHAFLPFIFPGTPHRITLEQVKLAEELIEDLKRVLEEEDVARVKKEKVATK